MPKKSKPTRHQARLDPQRSGPPEMIELVDPTWILKALGSLLALALVLGYVTLCVVFARTQWQLVLHPSRSAPTHLSDWEPQAMEVHFAPNTAGQPQLDGWWIPSSAAAGAPAGSASGPTVLMLHSGDGAIDEILPAARALHQARLNVFVFDYRGYGRSAGQHPTQALMQADAAAAFTYLTRTRGIPAASLLVYGTGVGGSLAVQLCAEHRELPALILESPDGDFETRILHDSRARFVPVRWFFHDRFPLADALHTLGTPKLLVSYSATPAPAPLEFQRAGDPKMTVELPASPKTSMQESLRRFLDTYVPSSPQTLLPAPTP